MKNRKRIITTLIGMTLTAQLSPVGYTIVNAQELTAQGQAQQGQAQQKTGLSDTKILLAGNGCWETSDPTDKNKAGRHEVEISFNTNQNGKMMLQTKVLSGYENDPKHSFHEYCPGEYIKLELIDGNTKRIKHQFAMSGKDNVGKLRDELNMWEFKYGDSLRIFHEEANSRTKITGTVINEETNKDILNYDTDGVSKSVLNNYQFRITQGGLVQEKQNIVSVDSADKLLEELIKLKKNKSQETIKLTQDINFNDPHIICKLFELSDKRELEIPEGVTIIGSTSSNKPVSIDLSDKTSVVLKGDYISLENIDIKNSNNTGVHVYGSSYTSLKNLSVTDSKGYGIYVNGSRVAMQGCKTSRNGQGGMLISSSLDLYLRRNKISDVTFKSNTNKFDENNQVTIKNLQLVKRSDASSEVREMQNNIFKVENRKMNEDEQCGQYKSQDHNEVKALNKSLYEGLLKQHGIDTNDVQVKEYYKIYKF